jgi:hypothetical protein
VTVIRATWYDLGIKRREALFSSREVAAQYTGRHWKPGTGGVIQFQELEVIDNAET